MPARWSSVKTPPAFTVWLAVTTRWCCQGFWKMMSTVEAGALPALSDTKLPSMWTECTPFSASSEPR